MSGVDPQPLRLRPRVRAVVVNYRGSGVTERCIESLLGDTESAVDLSIVMVDNSPDDGVAARVRSSAPDVEVRTTGRNEGFARGCNLALADLEGIDAVALVNNDAIAQPGWLAPLWAALSQPGVGAASPKILLNTWASAVLVDGAASSGSISVDRIEVDGLGQGGAVRFDERWTGARPSRPGACAWWATGAESPAAAVTMSISAERDCGVRIGDPRAPQTVHLASGSNTVVCRSSAPLRIVNSAGGGLYAGWLGGDIGFLEPDIGQYDVPAEVFGWCGGAVLLSAAYLRDVGVFDPSMFVYYEDFDLSCRGRSRGWRHVYEPSSVVLHDHAWSSRSDVDGARFWNDRNRRLAVAKNAPAATAARAVLGAARSGPRMAWSVLGALPATLVRRRRVRRRATVPAVALEAWMTAK